MGVGASARSTNILYLSGADAAYRLILRLADITGAGCSVALKSTRLFVKK
jgi:hypothetical protein